MKRALLALLAATSLSAVAQNETDILRYSQQFPTGTSRVQAMGGASGALGADLAAGSINPAGLGFYRRSVMSFSPGLRFGSDSARFMSETNRDSHSAMTMNNWGAAFAVKTGKKEGVRNWTFAFGQNQLANYNRSLQISGYNNQSSITDYFANEANGTADSMLTGVAQMAYDIYLINSIYDKTNQYYGAAQNGEDRSSATPRVLGVQQSLSQQETGRNNEWFVGTGLNISDILYVGASMGIQQVRYSRTSLFSENDTADVHKYYVDEENNLYGYPLEFPFKGMTYEETVNASGAGVNLKLGAIFEPTDFIRLGIAMQTPTSINIRETYNYTMTHDMTKAKADSVFVAYNGNGMNDTPSSTYDGTYDYRVVTPFRATASAMILFGKKGFLTADVEMVDYSQGLLKSNYNDNPFSVANKNAANLYQSALNIRLGGELRLGMARLRAGYALYDSPLTSSASEYLNFNGETLKIDAKTQCITFGAGVREKSYFADVAVVMSTGQDKFRPYNLSATQFSPTAVNSFSRTNINFTIGFILGESEE